MLFDGCVCVMKPICVIALNRFLCYFTVVYVHGRYLDSSCKQDSVFFHCCMCVHGRYLDGSSRQVYVLFHWFVYTWKILRW